MLRLARLSKINKHLALVRRIRMDKIKLFISQPMRGKSGEEILKEREIAIANVKEIIGKDVEVLDTFFDDFSKDTKPLQYLARSIEFLAKADIAYFAPGWSNARGCKIEHECAAEYGIEIIKG
jgi:hypothetical protein